MAFFISVAEKLVIILTQNKIVKLQLCVCVCIYHFDDVIMCWSGQWNTLVPFRIETLLYDMSSEHYTRAVLHYDVGITKTWGQEGGGWREYL